MSEIEFICFVSCLRQVSVLMKNLAQVFGRSDLQEQFVCIYLSRLSAPRSSVEVRPVFYLGPNFKYFQTQLFFPVFLSASARHRMCEVQQLQTSSVYICIPLSLFKDKFHPHPLLIFLHCLHVMRDPPRS